MYTLLPDVIILPTCGKLELELPDGITKLPVKECMPLNDPVPYVSKLNVSIVPETASVVTKDPVPSKRVLSSTGSVWIIR